MGLELGLYQNLEIKNNAMLLINQWVSYVISNRNKELFIEKVEAGFREKHSTIE
jgi:hypothetical protein